MTPQCKDIRADILRVSHASGHGHIPSCFSVVEILYAVYDFIRHEPGDPDWEGRDIFILSKGHAALGHYCVLARFGYMPIDALYSFGAFLSDFGCHADRLKVPGIEASTGSLGHGIGLAVGIALAQRLKKSDREVYTLIGDGEANEGTVWEAVLVAESLGLQNLTFIYDNNLSHGRGLQVPAPEKKLEAFGCHVIAVDGHDVEALKQAFAEPSPSIKAVVAHTMKGFGCRTMQENHYEWHRKSPGEEEMKRLLEELDAAAV